MPQPWGLDVGDLQIGRRKRPERVVLRHERGLQAVACIVDAPSCPRRFVTGVMPRADLDDAPRRCLQEVAGLRALQQQHMPPQA